ncbi:MAG: uracil-DNA glycosylase, partial [Verrucomicrobiia bacterium]
MDYSELLDATIDHLEEQQARGQRYVDVADATLEALNRPVHSPEAPARQQNTERERPGATRPSSRVGFQPAPVPPPEVPKVDLFVYDRSKPLSREEKENAMADLRSRAMQCVKCDQLVRSRQNVVFGVGNIHTDLMFIGEAPGMDEDQAGEPFVGKAGQLLNKVLQTMGLQRENIYIGNVLKCRPDTPGQRYGNRKPTPTEMNTCLPYLQAQIDIIRPKVIVC